VVSAATEVQPVLGPLEHEPRRALIVRHLCLLAPAVAAVALWAWSVPGIQLRAMNDLGLVSVLPWPTWLAFVLLTLGFIICWRRADQATWLLLVHVLLLIVMLYGLPALASHQPSGPVVYRHAGITADLTQNRVVDPKIDAYFNWPGFFMGLGTLVKLAGVPSALSFTTWATVAFNLLFLPPLLLVARALTRDPRLVWGTVWVFYAANWINQDYLAPQSFAYLLYLTIMGLLLTYLRPSGTDLERGGRLLRRFRQVLRVRAAEAQVPPVSRSTVAGILAVVVLLYAVIVASHQLTPFAILIGVLALVALGECTARGLPLLMGVMLTLWVTFVARGYLAGHFTHLVSGVGDITGATSANLTARISGSHLHLLVIRERLLLSGGLWLLALLGGIRRFRSRYADHAAAALALTPLLLFPLQAYGGEMLLRIYFFMLPFVAFFATAASCRPGRRSRPRAPTRRTSWRSGPSAPARGTSWWSGPSAPACVPACGTSWWSGPSTPACGPRAPACGPSRWSGPRAPACGTSWGSGPSAPACPPPSGAASPPQPSASPLPPSWPRACPHSTGTSASTTSPPASTPRSAFSTHMPGPVPRLRSSSRTCRGSTRSMSCITPCHWPR